MDIKRFLTWPCKKPPKAASVMRPGVTTYTTTFPTTTKVSRNMKLCFARLHKLTSSYIHTQLQKERNKPGFTQDTHLHSKELFTVNAECYLNK